jgi:uncharacterized damage-inducible protein DinB
MDRDLGETLLHLTRTRLLRDYPAQIETCLDVLDDEDLWWRPNEQANAVGNLVLHVSGSNRYYFDQVIGGRDTGRDRDAEFAARRSHTKAEVRQIWDETLRLVEERLTALDASRLMDTTDRTGKVSTIAQILLHVTHHNAAHMGQIVWVTKLRRPGALDDIWIKGNGR